MFKNRPKCNKILYAFLLLESEFNLASCQKRLKCEQKETQSILFCTVFFTPTTVQYRCNFEHHPAGAFQQWPEFPGLKIETPCYELSGM